MLAGTRIRKPVQCHSRTRVYVNAALRTEIQTVNTQIRSHDESFKHLAQKG